MSRRENLALGLRLAVSSARDGMPLAAHDVNILLCEAVAELLDPALEPMRLGLSVEEIAELRRQLYGWVNVEDMTDAELVAQIKVVQNLEAHP